MGERSFRLSNSPYFPVHLFDAYHDYTMCGQSVYAQGIKLVETTLPKDPKLKVCKKCERVNTMRKKFLIKIDGKAIEVRSKTPTEFAFVDDPNDATHYDSAFQAAQVSRKDLYKYDCTVEEFQVKK